MQLLEKPISSACSPPTSTFHGSTVESPPLSVKRAAVALEDSHPLGRLFDLDVIGPDGPLSRTEIGAPERRCLLCDRPARLCMRGHRHSYQELLAAIDTLLESC